MIAGTSYRVCVLEGGGVGGGAQEEELLKILIV